MDKVFLWTRYSLEIAGTSSIQYLKLALLCSLLLLSVDVANLISHVNRQINKRAYEEYEISSGHPRSTCKGNLSMGRKSYPIRVTTYVTNTRHSSVHRNSTEKRNVITFVASHTNIPVQEKGYYLHQDNGSKITGFYTSA